MAALGKLGLDLVIILSDVATGLAFTSVFQRLRATWSLEGLSLQTMVAAVSNRCLHVGSYQLGLHYNPLVLPRALFMFLDGVNALAGLLCLCFFFKYFQTYEKEKDNFGLQVFERLGCVQSPRSFWKRYLVAASWLYLMAGVTALFWHHIRRFAVHQVIMSQPKDYYLSFYEVLSAVALIPQLWMFHHDKRVPPTLANFVIFVAAHQVLVLTFWACFPWVSGITPINRNIQMVFDGCSLLILSDFLYYWARSKWYGYDEVVLDLEEIAMVATEWK